jgi:ketosteroid isomerase-like protein
MTTDTSSDTGTGVVSATHRLVNAFANADLDGVLREVTDDFAIEMPAAPRGAQRLITGRDEIATLIGHVTTTWKGVRLLHIEVHPLADDPNRVLAEYALEGTNLDDSTYHNDYTTVITFTGGKVSRFVEYFDPAPITQALDALRAHLRSVPGA